MLVETRLHCGLLSHAGVRTELTAVTGCVTILSSEPDCKPGTHEKEVARTID